MIAYAHIQPFSNTMMRTKSTTYVFQTFPAALHMEKRLKKPNPSKLKGDEVIYIEPETPVAFAIWLRKQREALGLSQSDVAKKLVSSIRPIKELKVHLKLIPR